jgi:hypothetical protein
MIFTSPASLAQLLNRVANNAAPAIPAVLIKSRLFVIIILILNHFNAFQAGRHLSL